ncbi:MAG: imidazole glycerol phosphate synthase subunit HisH [Rikenellaceae bacterium]
MIAVVDYDTGNLRSVANALSRLGAEFKVTDNHKEILDAERVLLPGVGEAYTAMCKLHERGLAELIPRLTQPVLGICIGVQLMCKSSEEGNAECLGIFDSDVRRFKFDEGTNLKVPQMGWNSIEQLKSPLFDGLDEGSYVYYVHSFAPELCSQTIAVTNYGLDYSAALSRDNFYGTQFHPEKSGDIGSKILENFLKI